MSMRKENVLPEIPHKTWGSERDTFMGALDSEPHQSSLAAMLSRLANNESDSSDGISCESGSLLTYPLSGRQGSCTSSVPFVCRWDRVPVVASD